MASDTGYLTPHSLDQRDRHERKSITIVFYTLDEVNSGGLTPDFMDSKGIRVGLLPVDLHRRFRWHQRKECNLGASKILPKGIYFGYSTLHFGMQTRATMNVARIFVISAQDIFREGIITIASNDPFLEIVGDATTVEDAMRSIETTAPKLIIIDLHGCDLNHDLQVLFRDGRPIVSRSIVITSNSTDYEIAQCIQKGVAGIVCRNVHRDEMLTAMHKVLSGRNHYCTHTIAKLRKDPKSNSLTKRELEVLQFLAFGLPNKEIAERLGVGIGTIKTHLININSKLHVTSRTEAVIRGIQKRLISI